jgi:hypothetical protein
MENERLAADKLQNQDLPRTKDEVIRVRNELAGQNDKLTKENEDLIRERENFIIGKGELTTQNDELTKEKEELTGRHDNFIRERDDLIRGKEGLARERDELAKEKDDFITRKEAFIREKADFERVIQKLEGQRVRNAVRIMRWIQLLEELYQEVDIIRQVAQQGSKQPGRFAVAAEAGTAGKIAFAPTGQ